MRPSPESATRPSTRSTVATSTRPKLIRTSTDVFSSEASKARASYAGRAGGGEWPGRSAAPTAPEEATSGLVVGTEVDPGGAVVVVARPQRLGVDHRSPQLGQERVVVAVLGLVAPRGLGRGALVGDGLERAGRLTGAVVEQGRLRHRR